MQTGSCHHLNIGIFTEQWLVLAAPHLWKHTHTLPLSHDICIQSHIPDVFSLSKEKFIKMIEGQNIIKISVLVTQSDISMGMPFTEYTNSCKINLAFSQRQVKRLQRQSHILHLLIYMHLRKPTETEVTKDTGALQLPSQSVLCLLWKIILIHSLSKIPTILHLMTRGKISRFI